MFCLFTGDLPTTVEEVKALGSDHLVDIVARNMNYFIGQNGTYLLSCKTMSLQQINNIFVNE